MAQHGRAIIEAWNARALGVCQRCGSLLNHDQLHWQWEYSGMKVINLRVLTCETCQDTPQRQLATIILPPDPTPIEFAVPEDYVRADNPLSPIGFALSGQTFGANTGTLVKLGGLDAAFDGNTAKSAARSAAILTSVSSLQNFIGKAWNNPIATSHIPSSITNTISYNVRSFSVYAPTDAPITTAAAALQLQGSSDGVTWVTLYSTTVKGTNGEIITSLSSNLSAGQFQQHRIAVAGSGGPIYVAQLQLSVADNRGE
jgi:hypothetical protein